MVVGIGGNSPDARAAEAARLAAIKAAEEAARKAAEEAARKAAEEAARKAAAEPAPPAGDAMNLSSGVAAPQPAGDPGPALQQDLDRISDNPEHLMELDDEELNRYVKDASDAIERHAFEPAARRQLIEKLDRGLNEVLKNRDIGHTERRIADAVIDSGLPLADLSQNTRQHLIYVEAATHDNGGDELRGNKERFQEAFNSIYEGPHDKSIFDNFLRTEIAVRGNHVAQRFIDYASNEQLDRLDRQVEDQIRTFTNKSTRGDDVDQGRAVTRIDRSYEDVQKAGGRIQELSQLKSQVLNSGTLTPEQEKAFTKAFEEKYKGDFDKFTAAQQGLAQDVSNNREAIVKALSSPDAPRGADFDKYKDALARLAADPAHAGVAESILTDVFNAAPTDGEGADAVSDRINDLAKDVLPLVLQNKATAAMGAAVPPSADAATQAIEDSPLWQSAQKLASSPHGEKSFDTVKKTTDAMDMTFEAIQKKDPDKFIRAAKGVNGVSRALGGLSVVMGIGKFAGTDQEARFHEQLKNAGELVSDSSNVLRNFGAFAKAMPNAKDFLKKYTPLLGVVTGGIDVANSFSKFLETGDRTELLKTGLSGVGFAAAGVQALAALSGATVPVAGWIAAGVALAGLGIAAIQESNRTLELNGEVASLVDGLPTKTPLEKYLSLFSLGSAVVEESQIPAHITDPDVRYKVQHELNDALDNLFIDAANKPPRSPKQLLADFEAEMDRKINDVVGRPGYAEAMKEIKAKWREDFRATYGL